MDIREAQDHDLDARYVAPAHRGRGCGRELVGAVEQWYPHRAIALLTSNTDPDYPLSPAARARAGFEKLHEFTIFIKRLTILLLALPGAAWTNGAEIGRDAGMIFPLESTVVHLAAETVDVRYDWMARRGDAECVYHLGNGSDSSRTFDMAFVTNAHNWLPGNMGPFYAELDMVVDIDGAAVPVQMAPVHASSWADLVKPPPDSLPAWTVTIPPRDTVRVHMTYRVWPSGGSDGHTGGMALTYRCRPAALWAGPVGKAVIRFRMDRLEQYVMRSISSAYEIVCLDVRPTGWGTDVEDRAWDREDRHRAERVFVWEFQEWEPEEDVSVGVEWRERSWR